MKVIIEYYNGHKFNKEVSESVIQHHIANGVTEEFLREQISWINSLNPEYIRTIFPDEYTIEVSKSGFNWATEISFGEDIDVETQKNSVEDILQRYQLEILPHYKKLSGYSFRTLVIDDSGEIVESQYIPTSI